MHSIISLRLQLLFNAEAVYIQPTEAAVDFVVHIYTHSYTLPAT